MTEKRMSVGHSTDQNNLLVSLLSLERCIDGLAHLRATMYMCNPSNFGLDDNTLAHAQGILSQIDHDLHYSLSYMKSQIGEPSLTS